MPRQTGDRKKWGWYFNPAEGFKGGQYVLFDGSTNPFAQQQMWFTAKMQQKDLYEVAKQELIDSLEKMVQNERAKEIAYIANKVNKIEASITAGEEVPAFMLKIRSLYQGHAPGYISAILNVILSTEKQLKKISQELTDKGNQSKLLKESVFDRKFDVYLYNYIKNSVGGLGKRSIAQDPNFMNLTMKELVTQFVNQAFKDLDVGEGEVKEIQDEYVDKLYETLKQATTPILPKSWFRSNQKISPAMINKFISDKKTTVVKKDGSSETLAQKTKRLSKATAKIIAGKSLEVVIKGGGAGKFGKGKSVNTGSAEGDIDNIIGDFAQIDVSIDIEAMADEILHRGTGTGHEKLVRLVAALESSLQDTSSAILAISAKDYASNFDFSVKGSTGKSGTFNFTSVTNRLSEMAGAVGGSFDVNEFAFILNNTISGAFLQGMRDYVLDVIGYTAAAFMFDDVKGMFSAQGGGHTIHLYNIGGTYFGLSELLGSVITAMSSISEDSLVSVKANWADDVVANMRQEYYESMDSQIYPGMDELKRRWSSVREGARKSTVSIDMRYEVIKNAASVVRGLLG